MGGRQIAAAQLAWRRFLRWAAAHCRLTLSASVQTLLRVVLTHFCRGFGVARHKGPRLVMIKGQSRNPRLDTGEGGCRARPECSGSQMLDCYGGVIGFITSM